MEPTTHLLPEAHRVIRPVDAGESAFVGVLVADGDGVRVRVDVETVGAALWRYGDAAHVAGVRDLVRRSDGHDALLPWCAERVATFLARREGAGASLSPGEAVTLVASMLRGIEECGGEALVGVWWLADDARPLFVAGEGDAVIGATRTLVGQVRGVIADRALDRALAEIERMPDDHRVIRQRLAVWETNLTAHAAPRALQRDVFAPEPVTGIPLHRAHVAVPLDERAEAGVRGLIRRAADAVGRHAGAVGAIGRRLMPARGERAPRQHNRHDVSPRPGRAPRRRMVILAAGAGVIVLAAGLMWPQEPEPSQADEVLQTSTAQPADETAAEESPRPVDATGAAAPPAGDTKGAPPDGTEAVATTLVSALASCRSEGDTTCAVAVAPGAGERVLAALMADVSTPDITPVEDYGDVAVVRLDANGVRQMLVLVRQNDSWLVRDVYDVADQP